MEDSHMHIRILATALLMLVAGCSHTGAIQSASSGKSGFDGAVYSGDTVELQKPTPGAEPHRIFHQGASSFVSLAAVRGSAENRAAAYCANLGKAPRYIRETASRPPHILGNFPRIELEFECADRLSKQNVEAPDPDRYAKLERLKRLLDSGALSQQEYATEKARILGTP
jgi:hypothetical protein